MPQSYLKARTSGPEREPSLLLPVVLPDVRPVEHIRAVAGKQCAQLGSAESGSRRHSLRLTINDAYGCRMLMIFMKRE